MKKPNHSGSGQIRIIGGQWRGRKLPVPDSPGLRPHHRPRTRNVV
ncbi:RsmD family RNA methyltransferase [Escherichia coli]